MYIIYNRVCTRKGFDAAVNSEGPFQELNHVVLILSGSLVDLGLFYELLD